MADPSVGPILKDWQYYTFWGLALGLGVACQIVQVVLLWLIWRKL